MNLDNWLSASGKTVASFARSSGVSRFTLHKVINGTPISRRMAAKIYKATRCAITPSTIRVRSKDGIPFDPKAK